MLLAKLSVDAYVGDILRVGLEGQAAHVHAVAAAAAGAEPAAAAAVAAACEIKQM